MYKSKDRDQSDFLFFTAVDYHFWILLPFWPIIVVSFLGERDSEDATEPAQLPEPPAASNFTGKTGQTSSALRPAGHVRIEGNEYEATTETGLIERGINVRIVGQSGEGLRVCPLDPPDSKT